jgi:fructose-bisphosphate aldolase class I
MARFIAAMDHSGGSTGGVLERYEQEYTEADKMEKVHAMRLRMVGSPNFNDKNIWGAILYSDTVERGMVNILDDMGIESFLNIDSGCEENGLLKNFDVKGMCEFATQRTPENGSIGAQIYGTKMRSIVKSVDMVRPILTQQFQLAETICSYGLVPIIEPEVPIDHPEKALVEQELYALLEKFLNEKKFKVILKLTPPDAPNLYHNLTVKHNVERVVFLSGGYSTNEACNRLGLNENVSASFSRALSQDLRYDLTEEEFNATISNNIKQITEASE